MVRRIRLQKWTRPNCTKLQFEQEQQFARAICTMPKGSEKRAQVTSRAYDTVCTILAAQQKDDSPLVMGLDKRYVRLVLELLHRQINLGFGQPRLFEIGFGSGAMLKDVSDHGFSVSGLEISPAMHDAALEVLGNKFEDRLILGDLLQIEKNALPGRPSLAYWNDVFEHICPDEISDYLTKIYELLVPGGSLVTITPNWLLRPSDVTGDFCPPRTEARGLHLKEYRLAEVSALLKQAGFKQLARLPVRYTDLLCRGWGISCTIATK